MRDTLDPALRQLACETERKLGRYVLPALLAVWLVAGPVAAVRAVQPEPSAATAGEATHEGKGGGTIDVVARMVNFGILVGTLVYFLRTPLANYLRDRSTAIRSDLVNAEAMKQSAAAQIQEIERKMKALPGELEALRTEGEQEIATEEERIRVAATTERDRLIEQARREIDLQVKVAERALVSHAAELAVGVASQRIKRNITDDDQKRLVDRYVSQLKS
jgi:F-type H+-transporting ATPase subunit b